MSVSVPPGVADTVGAPLVVNIGANLWGKIETTLMELLGIRESEVKKLVKLVALAI
jgi:hypothetical protein